MPYTKVSVLKTDPNAGRPVAFRDKVILFDMDDVDVFPARDDKGVLIAGNLTLKAGAVALEMYVTPKSLKFGSAVEGDFDKKGYIQTLEFEHPGDTLEFNEFAENGVNTNWGAIVERYDGTGARLLGTPGCPLQFEGEQQNDSEAVTNMVKFTSVIRGPRIANYAGTHPTLDTDP